MDYFYRHLHISNNTETMENLPFIYENSYESKELHKKYEELQKKVTSSVAIGKFRKYSLVLKEIYFRVF